MELENKRGSIEELEVIIPRGKGANNEFHLEIKVNPLTIRPYSLEFTYVGDPEVYKRILNTIIERKLYLIYTRYFSILRKWYFTMNSSLINSHFNNQIYKVEKAIKNEDILHFETEVSAEKAKVQIAALLNSYAKSETDKYLELDKQLIEISIR